MNIQNMKFRNEDEIEEVLSTPSEELVNDFRQLDGDIIFLGVAGKMGISMAGMAKKAIEMAGAGCKVFGVSRFSSDDQRVHLEKSGITAIKGNLVAQDFLQTLPDAKQVIFLAGQKFGTVGLEHVTWTMNSYLPGLIAYRYKQSRIVALSTGCVYPLVPIDTNGSVESDQPDPIGEYAQSCLGRERLFQYGSMEYTPLTIIRLYYSVEMRFGVLQRS